MASVAALRTPAEAATDGVVDELVAVGPRGACSDGERRAARLLAARVRALGRRPRTEALWVRPQWPAIWLLHALLGVAGVVVGTEAPVAGLVVLAVAAVSALAELAAPGGRIRLLALLWPRRATQDVVSEPFEPDLPVRLVVSAAYDAPRVASPLTRALARHDARVRAALRGHWPHPLGLLALALVALAVLGALRVALDAPGWIGPAQLAPTLLALGACAVLADLALAPASPGANADGSAVAAALALVARLDAVPPRRLAVELLLAGAGDAVALGARAYVGERRRALAPEEVAFVHLAPCGAGTLHHWTHEGPLVRLALHPRLRDLAAEHAGSRPHAGRGLGAAHAARRRRWPALVLGRLDVARTAPGTRAPDDEPGALDPAEIRATVDAAERLIRALDRDLARPATRAGSPGSR